ncbi:MAG: hypothetical protein AAB213_01255 [Candidatus Omnitrophota bacterium]
MRLKKFLKSCGFKKCGQARHCCDGGQAVVEYFILLVLLAALTIIGGSVLFGKVQITTDRFRNSAFDKMAP